MASSRVLKSWKEISNYLQVGMRTAQRWERDFDLPVHRIGGHRGSAVVSIVEELDKWLQTRPAGGLGLGPRGSETGADSDPIDYGGTLMTDLLWKRPSRPAQLEKEIEIVRKIIPQIANQDPACVLNNLVVHAMELCKVDAAGVSLAEANDHGEAVFRWTAAAGKMKEHLGGTTPRTFSPCAVCLERNAPQLFSFPERSFTYLQDLDLSITELLLIPLFADSECFGTLWVFSHETPRKFDREDARILSSLADFAGIAVRMMRLQQHKARADECSVAEFQAMTRLYEIGSRCAHRGSNFDEYLDAAVVTAIGMTEADKGNLQLFDPALGGLTIAAQRGFDEPFLKFFAVVRDDVSACGAAMQSAQRIVVEDVMQSDVFAGRPSLDVLLAAGVRAVQSIPLISSSGKVVGMISTHFRRPHRPDKRQLHFMDLLARQATDYVERMQSKKVLRCGSEQFKILFDNAPVWD